MCVDRCHLRVVCSPHVHCLATQPHEEQMVGGNCVWGVSLFSLSGQHGYLYVYDALCIIPCSLAVLIQFSPCRLVIQIVYSCVSLAGGRNEGGKAGPGVSSLPPSIWLPSLLWPLLALPLNEFIKHREIR